MDLQNEKCVMVIDENLPMGIIANTAAILGITLGKKRPYVVGCDVEDQSGGGHLGIVELPVPILKGNPGLIREIREKLYQPGHLRVQEEGQQADRKHAPAAVAGSQTANIMFIKVLQKDQILLTISLYTYKCKELMLTRLFFIILWPAGNT